MAENGPIPDVREVPFWAFIIDGNPITVESWLINHGYKRGFANSPHICLVDTVQKI